MYFRRFRGLKTTSQFRVLVNIIDISVKKLKTTTFCFNNNSKFEYSHFEIVHFSENVEVSTPRELWLASRIFIDLMIFNELFFFSFQKNKKNIISHNNIYDTV